MTDLTKLEKPFGLLDKETQEALEAHYEGGGSIEVLTSLGWLETKTPLYYNHLKYRAAPKKHKVRLWVHLYKNGMFDLYSEPNPAIHAIAIKQIEVELTAGEGL